jgi:hypothetical protein
MSRDWAAYPGCGSNISYISTTSSLAQNVCGSHSLNELIIRLFILSEGNASIWVRVLTHSNYSTMAILLMYAIADMPPLYISPPCYQITTSNRGNWMTGIAIMAVFLLAYELDQTNEDRRLHNNMWSDTSLMVFAGIADVCIYESMPFGTNVILKSIVVLIMLRLSKVVCG